MKFSIKKIITPSMPFSMLLVLGTIIIWIIVNVFVSTDSGLAINSPLSKVVEGAIHSELISNIISLIITLFNAFLLVQINNRFTIIRTRTFIPVFVFLMVMSVLAKVHQLPNAQIALTFQLAALFVFFGMFRNRNASEQAFLGSLLVAIGSLFVVPMIFFLPLSWIGFARFRSLSMRTFLASLIGTIVPWIFYFSIRYYLQPDLVWLNILYSNFQIGFILTDIPLNELIYIASMAIIIIIGLVGLFSNLHGDSLQSRAYLNFLLILLIFSVAFSFIFINEYYAFIPIVIMSFSILLAHPFTLKPFGFYAILFYILVLVNFTYLISNII